MKNVHTATPKEFVNLIDKKFSDLVGKIRRVDLQWGQWSFIMNKEIKKRINVNSSPGNGFCSMVDYKEYYQ